MTSEIEIVENKRVVLETRSATRRERARWWIRNVLNAMTDRPPREVTSEKIIGPDDPRWEQGMIIAYRWMNFSSVNQIPPLQQKTLENLT